MKLKWKIALPVLALLLLSTLLTTMIHFFITRSSVDHIIDTIIESNLDTLVSQVERAAETERVMLGEMDKKNLALTRAFAEIVRLIAANGELDPQDEASFQRLSDMLDVSEVHIMDREGVLIGGSIRGYYGFDFRTSDQTIPFLRILDNPAYELAQEPQPNGAEQKLFQYTGTARTDAKGIVQVGLDAQVIQRFRDLLDTANTAKGMRIGSTGRASIIQDGIIAYSQRSNQIGQDCSGESWYRQVSSGRGKGWMDIDGETYYVGYANTGGMTLLVLFPQAEYRGYLSSSVQSSAVGVFVAILITVITYFLVSRSLKPLTFLSAFMSKAGATGDILLQPEEAEIMAKLSQGKDEIGQTMDGCAGFIQHITKIASELESAASGDLTIDIEQLSEADIMGISLSHMVRTLDTMFVGINQSAQQVLTGAKQAADGAQALAQSSTQQAASVEELSASINGIAQKIRENATTAAQTSQLSETIKTNAEKGSRQMNEMTVAVAEINQASQSIGKIIKTIDDIAFQTNILALNAAVEAARAGEHGKGFAVVAEEVRNLASKSAEAAKETESLIANSMEKAELGSRMAEETAASLSEIVSGINESTALVNEIAESLESESEGVSQINTGIDQVASLVQQNSASAEESAATSEEMSAQSAILQNLVSQFKLRR
ncbi:MAG: methyl-accepting chemotaxis protein [Clostridiales bacterium]|nr:methyl-accepting chemotaxis protein [Clostridiales bacterium]